LAQIGTYQVFFQVSVTEAGQLILTLNGADLEYTESGRYCSGAYYYTSCRWNQTCFSTSCYYSDSVNELIYSYEISEQSVSRSCFYFPGKSLAYFKI